MTEPQPFLQACPSCATLLDVSEMEPFALVHCPICGTAVRARVQFNNFTLKELLGSGGMGSVFRATDINLHREVAIKIVRPEFSQDREYVARFENEARITAAVNHPHVVKVFSFGAAQRLYYIAMELVDKGSLEDLMALQHRVAEAQVLEIGHQVATGLQAAHRAGLVHRDVKPGNILFADAHTAKVVDFGLAILQEREAEKKDEVWGTPYYVCPERLDHRPEDCRSDMYSLGATLFHAIAGRPPVEAETASMAALKQLKSRAVSLETVAPEVSTTTAFVVNRMLQPDPEQRHATYDELLEHLQFARKQVRAEAAKARREGKMPARGDSEGRRRTMPRPLLGIAAAIIVAAALLFVFRDQLAPGTGAGQRVATAAAARARTQYEEARRRLIAGDATQAAKLLAAIDQSSAIPQPLRNWILLNEGLAAAMTGDAATAAKAFADIQAAGLYSREPADLALANFFVEAARLYLEPGPVPARIAQNIDARGCEVFGLLLSGVKDWQLGEFDEARALFDLFGRATPARPFDWIAQYRPVASRYLSDYEVWRQLQSKLVAATTADAKQELLGLLPAARAQLQVGGKLDERLTDLARELAAPAPQPAESPPPPGADNPDGSAPEPEPAQ